MLPSVVLWFFKAHQSQTPQHARLIFRVISHERLNATCNSLLGTTASNTMQQRHYWQPSARNKSIEPAILCEERQGSHYKRHGKSKKNQNTKPNNLKFDESTRNKHNCYVCMLQIALTKVLAHFARVPAEGTFFDARACGPSHLKSVYQEHFYLCFFLLRNVYSNIHTGHYHSSVSLMSYTNIFYDTSSSI